MTDVVAQHASPSGLDEAAAQPKMKVHQETFTFMNQQPVYVQIVEMETSVWVWVSSAATILSQAQLMGSAPESGSGGGGSGAFGDFAIGMPPYRTMQASSTTLLGNAMEDTAAGMARRLATRFKMQCLVNLDLSVHGDNGMLLAFAEKKVSDMLKTLFATE